MKKILSLLRNDMKNFVWILLLGIICSCGSNGSLTEEPNGGRTNGDDSAIVDEPEPLTAELRPVLTNGKKWEMIYQRPNENYIYCFKLVPTEVVCEVVGDTVAYGENCKKISRIRGEYADTVIWHEKGGALYDVNPQLVDGEGESEWIYDLTFAYTFFPKDENMTTRYKTLSKGTVVCMGKTRRAIKVYTQYSPTNVDYYVEGIGPVYGTCLSWQIVNPSCPNARCYILQKCYDGDELIFDINDFKPETYKEEVRFIEDYDKWFDF